MEAAAAIMIKARNAVGLDQQPTFDGKRQRLPVERAPFLSQGILPHRLDFVKEMTVTAPCQLICVSV